MTHSSAARRDILEVSSGALVPSFGHVRIVASCFSRGRFLRLRPARNGTTYRPGGPFLLEAQDDHSSRLDDSGRRNGKTEGVEGYDLRLDGTEGIPSSAQTWALEQMDPVRGRGVARNAAPRSDPRSGRARHDVIHTNGKGPRLTANGRGPLCPSKEGKLHICTPSEFLTALWGPTPHTRILVWTMSERRSHWLRDPKEADRAWDGDTYTGAALPGPTVKLEDNVRGEAKQAGAIAGLWVDVDYEDEHAHRKANLPSFVEARDFVQGVDPTLTITVRSGHGYQLWWLFKGRPVGIQVRHRARGSRATVRTLAERTPPAARQGVSNAKRYVPVEGEIARTYRPLRQEV